MYAVRRVLAAVVGILGLALIVKGLSSGVWPMSLQFLAGLLLVAFAVLNWRRNAR